MPVKFLTKSVTCTSCAYIHISSELSGVWNLHTTRYKMWRSHRAWAVGVMRNSGSVRWSLPPTVAWLAGCGLAVLLGSSPGHRPAARPTASSPHVYGRTLQITLANSKPSFQLDVWLIFPFKYLSPSVRSERQLRLTTEIVTIERSFVCVWVLSDLCLILSQG